MTYLGRGRFRTVRPAPLSKMMSTVRMVTGINALNLGSHCSQRSSCLVLLRRRAFSKGPLRVEFAWILGSSPAELPGSEGLQQAFARASAHAAVTLQADRALCCLYSAGAPSRFPLFMLHGRSFHVVTLHGSCFPLVTL